jgi:AraC-like DNA-binding protein
MERLLLAPGPPLSRFVELLWYYRNDPQPHGKERLMPDGCISVVINLAEDRTRLYDPDDTRKMFTLDGCTLSGPQTKSFAIDTDEQNHVVGISFRPAGAVPFLKLSSTELCDQHLELSDLWGFFARQLRDRVVEAPTPAAKLHALEIALLQRAAGMLDDHPTVEYAVKTFLHSPQTANITKIVSETGFSSRRFIELFKHHVGLTPKLFCRVRRFQSVLRRITSGRPVRWADVALDCGYFDQAHFIHDSRAFSGINPSKYISDHSAFPGHHNHLPILP